MQVNSDFTGSAKREGNTITVHGTLTHKLKDLYDFDASLPNEYVAAKDGCAKPFVSEAVWEEGVVGSVKVDKKGLGNPVIKTYSLDEEE